MSFAKSSPLIVLIALSLSGIYPAFAQNAPAPGALDNNQSAPIPGQALHASNNAHGETPAGGYRQLPLSAGDAQTRLEELKVLLAQSRPQAIQEAVYQLCEWLSDMTEAHYKLANTFAKSDATKPQAETEKQAAIKFSRLKNQAQLLKADLLIKQCRFPEALGPLVDIVVAEPRSSTGQEAYKRLQEIGFAEELDQKSETKSSTNSQPKETTPVSQNPKPAQAAPTVVARAESLPKTKKAHTTSNQLWMSGTPYGAGSRKRHARSADND